MSTASIPTFHSEVGNKTLVLLTLYKCIDFVGLSL